MKENEKELRKILGLPLTKELRYVRGDFMCKVIDFKIVDTYMPSGTHSLMITLEDGSQKRILAPYFAEMQ